MAIGITIRRRYGFENFKLPSIPNCIIRNDDGFPVDISEFSEKQLRDIAGMWRNELIAKSVSRKTKP